MKTMTRESVINELVDDEMDTCRSEDGRDYLEAIVRRGIVGFEFLSDDDLVQVYWERFEEEVEINNLNK